MMERTHAFLKRSIGGFDTNYYRTETYPLRSYENSYHRITGASVQLLERQERQVAYDADRFKDIAIRLLERKIQHLERVILCPDREVKFREEIFDLKNDKIYGRKQRLVHDLQGKDEQLSDMGDKLQQSETSLHEAKIDGIIMSKENIIQNQERENDRRDLQIKDRQEILNSKKVEISKGNELDMAQQPQDKEQNKGSDKDADLNSHIALLEAELECRDRKVGELEKMLDSKEIEVNDGKTLLQNTLEKNERQLSEQRNNLHKTLTKLQETEAKMDKTVFSLSEKNQDLQAVVEGCNLKIKTLQDILDSKKVAVDERDERQVKGMMRQKDDKISDLRHQLKQTQKELDVKETEMNGIITSLKNKVDDLGIELERRNMKIKDLEVSIAREKEEASDAKELLENKVKGKDCQLHKQRGQLLQMFETMHEKEAEMEVIIASLKKKIKHQENWIENRNLRLKYLEEVLNRKTKGIPARDKPNKDVKQVENKITELTGQLDQTVTKHHATELDETKTRLSKSLGSMLTDNKPNIAELSDKNRPTKLAERYTELYDNQWTEAFENMLDKQFLTEESIITALLKILKDAMTFCKNKAHEQMKDLQRILAFSNKHEGGSVPIDMRMLFKNCQKGMASVAVEHLYTMYMSHIRQSKNETIKTALEVGSFTKECLEVCWFMVVQDPPIVFAPGFTKGSRFNTDLFKPYICSGALVDYEVWPALLLHECGPVLAKGVAQGFGKTSK